MFAYMIYRVPKILEEHPSGLTFEEIRTIIFQEWKTNPGLRETYNNFGESHLRLYLGYYPPRIEPIQNGKLHFLTGRIIFKDNRFVLEQALTTTP